METSADTTNTTTALDDRFNLITRHLQEVIGGHNLRDVMMKRNPEIYWGTAPTSSPSIGYFIPVLKLKDFLDAGCNVKILIADVHAFFELVKTSSDNAKHISKEERMKLIGFRSEYYIRIVKAMLRRIGADPNKITFIKGSSYQFKEDIIYDLFDLMSVTKTSQAQKAGTEVVKKLDDPYVNSLLYPALQALDEIYLNADAELGGLDQRKIFAYSRDFLPMIKQDRKFTHLMNPVISLAKRKGKDDITKMNSSDSDDKNRKIGVLDTPSQIFDVMKSAYCLDGNITENPVLSLIKAIVFVVSDHFDLMRTPEHGGIIVFSNYDELEQQVLLGSSGGGIHPSDLKYSLAHFLSDFLEPIRQEFQSEENLQLIKDAYPIIR